MATYDLTQPLDADVTVYPGDPDVEVRPHATHDEDGYRVSAVELGSHSGTHVDAPNHTEPDGRTLDEFPVEAFSFDAVRADCTGAGAREPIRADDLPASALDADADVDAVVIHTGWDDHWGTDRYLDHPYLAPDVAQQLAAAGRHVAVDALNVDPTPTDRASDDEPAGVPAHRALLGADRLIVENLTNLDAPPDRFELCAYPLALADADGAPVRAVARVEA